MAAYTPIYRCALVREGSAATRPKISGVVKAKEVANSVLADSPNEQLLCLMLDTKHRVIGVVSVTSGTLDASLVHAREFYRPAILANAAAVIVAHNHPSGDLAPSAADWSVYRMLKKAGDLLGIALLDSIIVDGLGAALSMAEYETC